MSTNVAYIARQTFIYVAKDVKDLVKDVAKACNAELLISSLSSTGFACLKMYVAFGINHSVIS